MEKHKQRHFSFECEEFRLQKSDCSELFCTHWGENSLLIVENKVDLWICDLTFYIQETGYIQVKLDIGDFRITENNPLTQHKRYLRISGLCDEENVDEIKAFIEELASQGWFKIKTRRF